MLLTEPGPYHHVNGIIRQLELAQVTVNVLSQRIIGMVWSLVLSFRSHVCKPAIPSQRGEAAKRMMRHELRMPVSSEKVSKSQPEGLVGFRKFSSKKRRESLRKDGIRSTSNER